MTTSTSPLVSIPRVTRSATIAAATQKRALQPFRFLDLPAELRCMVYEELDVVTRRHTLSDSDVRQAHQEDVYEEHDLSITLTRNSLPVAVLRVCKQVQSEVASFLAPKLRQLEMKPLRFHSNYVGAAVLTRYVWPLARCFNTSFTTTDYISDAHIRAFVTRCRNFLSHTRRVSRIDTNNVHVEFIISTCAAVTGLHGDEVYGSISGAASIASNRGLAVMVTCHNSFPDSVLTTPWGTPTIVDGMGSWRHLDFGMRVHTAADEVSPIFRYHIIESDEAWAELLEEGK
jgi:hypothetical protein